MRVLRRREKLHRLSAGPAIPGLVLRAGIALLAVLALSVFPFTELAIWLLLALAVVAIVVPRVMAAWMIAALVALAMLFSEPELGRTSLALLIVHGLHLLGALTVAIPAASLVQLRALLPSLRRFAGVQLVSQLLLAAAASLSSGVDAVMPWLAPLGALCLLLLTVLLARQPRG